MNYPQIKPTLNLDFSNTKTLDPRINFRRGTPGAYYDGKTYAKAEENLIEYSEDFSQWNKTDNLLQPSLVQDASPIGTDAYKLICDNTPEDFSFAYMPLSKQNYLTSYSIYVKADGFNYAWIGFCYDNTLRYQAFVVDLTSGQVLDLYTRDRGNLMSVNVVSSGDDWYRIEFVSDGHIANYFSIGGIDDPSTDLSSDGRPVLQSDNTSGILVWGAQVEDRGYVTAYTPTNGTPVTKYQPQLMFASPDQPRFDHDALTGESKGLLIEESRTNLVPSSNVAQSNYLSSNIYDYAIAPDGTQSVVYSTFESEGAAVVMTNANKVATGNHCYSVYIKPAGLSEVSLADSEQNITTRFYLDSNTYNILSSASTAGIEDVGNGWKRIWMVGSSVTTSTYYQLYGYGLPTDDFASVLWWGAQLEEGSFPTSYIKTSGAPSGTERSADNASITGENFSSWYRQDEGSLYCETSKRDIPSSVVPVSVDAGTLDYIFLNLRSSESFEIKKNNKYQVSNLGFSDVTAETYHKIIGAYKKDSAAVSINGLSPLIENTCEIPLVSRLTIGSFIGDTQNVHIKKLAYYPQRLTNEQLQQLTK